MTSRLAVHSGDFRDIGIEPGHVLEPEHVTRARGHLHIARAILGASAVSSTADPRFYHLYLWDDDRVVEGEARYAFTVDETGHALDGQEVYVSRFIDDGSLEYSFETTTPGMRITAAPLVSLESLIAETEPRATPVP
jgi:hypothetical protein